MGNSTGDFYGIGIVLFLDQTREKQKGIHFVKVPCLE
jgi:hypothetical protein